MRTRRVYLDADFETGTTLDLPAEVVNYLRNVLRLKDGQPLMLFNGRGLNAHATLGLARRTASVSIEQVATSPAERSLPITLLAALAKGEKMDWIIQKAVELGVQQIVPVTTERAVLDLTGKRAEKRLQRWQQIMVHACVQCGRDFLPQLHPITDLTNGLEQVQTNQAKLILDPRATQPLTDLQSQTPPESAAFLVGPEGGFTEDEVTNACQSGFVALSLGPRILRAETAAITGMAILQYQWGDLGNLD